MSIKGEGIVTGSTATNNIKVSKDTTGKSTGLVVGLAEKLTGMTGFETKKKMVKNFLLIKMVLLLLKTEKMEQVL